MRICRILDIQDSHNTCPITCSADLSWPPPWFLKWYYIYRNLVASLNDPYFFCWDRLHFWESSPHTPRITELKFVKICDPSDPGDQEKDTKFWSLLHITAESNVSQSGPATGYQGRGFLLKFYILSYWNSIYHMIVNISHPSTVRYRVQLGHAVFAHITRLPELLALRSHVNVACGIIRYHMDTKMAEVMFGFVRHHDRAFLGVLVKEFRAFGFARDVSRPNGYL